MKKTYGKLPSYLTTRMREAAAQKKKDSPEAQAKCKHEGTRKYGTSLCHYQYDPIIKQNPCIEHYREWEQILQVTWVSMNRVSLCN